MLRKKTIVLCGGMIEEDFALKVIRDESPDVIIAVDKGLEFLYKHKIEPNLILGDFDSVDKTIISHYQNQGKIPIHQHQSEKDASDMELALELCVEMGYQKITILGATGNRLDHFLGSIQSLKLLLDANSEGVILDRQNKIRLLKSDFTLAKKDAFGKYFSIFPLGGTVENVNLQGAKYPLENYQLTPYTTRCISNEILEKELKVSFDSGIIIFMETKD